VRDPNTAEELAQEFALRFLRGDFRRASPQKGRFRNYLRTVLVHLVDDHHNERKAAPRPLVADAAAPPEVDTEQDFAASCREDRLARTWAALAAVNPTYHAALLLRVEERDLTSPVMAERLTAQLGKPINAALVRKTLERAQEKFADLLLDEVAG